MYTEQMANRRILSWSTAMRDLRRERAPRASVREERLRATSGLKNPPALTSWRGRSGRRYVVGVHRVEPDVADIADAVMIAVQRDGTGIAEVVEVAALGPQTRRQRLRWLAAMRVRGATEMHVHRLAESDAERRAVAADLAASCG